jgi:hypothetical protein
VYYEARSGKVCSLNAGWNSYLEESDPRRIPVSDLRPFPFAGTPLAEWKDLQGLSLLPEDRLTKMHAKALASALSEIPGQQQPRDTNHSDSIVVVDRFGNVAALVHTINGFATRNVKNRTLRN